MADVLLRPGTPADAAAVQAFGEAVVPATYGPLDAAYAEMMLREWWSTEGLAASLGRMPHVVAVHEHGNDAAAASHARHGFGERERVSQAPYPDDIWMVRRP